VARSYAHSNTQVKSFVDRDNRSPGLTQCWHEDHVSNVQMCILNIWHNKLSKNLIYNLLMLCSNKMKSCRAFFPIEIRCKSQLFHELKIQYIKHFFSRSTFEACLVWQGLLPSCCHSTVCPSRWCLLGTCQFGRRGGSKRDNCHYASPCHQGKISSLFVQKTTSAWAGEPYTLRTLFGSIYIFFLYFV
jgi:hypothetical protein